MKDRTPHIHERFLRHIWSQQYLQHTRLRTTDGKPVRVIDVGTINTDGGPDFHNAKVKIGPVTFVGDVEIHRNALEWLEHRHQYDPRYNKVILHVVLEADSEQRPILAQSGRVIPTLVLEPFLSESIRSLWQKTILDERARKSETIKCYQLNHNVPADIIQHWLHRLSVERMELKLRRFEERIKDLAHMCTLAAHEPIHAYGALPMRGDPDDIPPPHKELTQKDLSKKEFWEQVLYEGFMECLGYTKNQEPFSRLARSVTLPQIRELKIENEQEKIQALLFGAAGLLPKVRSVKEKESKTYARMLIRNWNELRTGYRSAVLHAADWQFFPTRPTNFPTLRLAAASGLIQKFLRNDLFRKVIQTIKSDLDLDAKQEALKELLHINTEGFWSHHYHFDESTPKPIRALGKERINDMVVNAVIPFTLLYARTFKDKEVREQTLKLYESFPPSMENSLTRLMEQQLLKGKTLLKSVALQQGAIQLYKFYCREERCSECEVGKLVFQDVQKYKG